MLLMAVTAAKAQEATVKRVEPLANEVIVAADRRKDLNDSYCALVRVEVLADDVQFSGNIIGPVEHRTGHYRVFVSPGTRFLRIESGTFLPVMIDTREYGIQGMQSNCTYVVTLSLPTAAPAPASAGMNYLVMTVSPANARVTVDGKEQEVRNGSVKVLLRNGTYPYHVEAPGYLPEDGQVTVNNARAERAVTLRSNKGTLTVDAATPGTEIHINGERVGAGSWRGELLPNTYLVEGRLPGYRNAEQVVTVTSGQTAAVSLPALTAITGSLNVDYEPVGASISIDGTARGTTPAVIDNLLVGTHSVTIAADGHTPQTLTATISEGQLATLTGALAKAATNLKPFLDKTSMKYGYRDEHGYIVIPAKYDNAWNFSEGLAFVEVNGKWGCIDKTDKMIIPAKYDNAIIFSEGLAAVKINGKWGFIDKTDKLIIPAKYDTAWYFTEGLATVKINGRSFYIDRNGNEVK